MTPGWHESAREQLLRLRVAGCGWGYRPDSPAYVEPTALACLALLASEATQTDSPRRQAPFGNVDFEARHPITRPASPQEAELLKSAFPSGSLGTRDGADRESREAVERSADWLQEIQGADGSLGLSATQATPGWTTPYAMLLWLELDRHAEARDRAVEWLLSRQGHAFEKPPGSPIGHDTTIRGWPWVEETHAWLEPTALGVLALARSGYRGHDRTREGIRLIRDRAVRSGGWNYGNNAVFGRDLRPQPAPTGLALAALATTGERDGCVDRAVEYLGEFLPQTRSPQSLGWGLAGLKAWGARPAGCGDWLAEAFEQSIRRRDPAPQLAYLLLADGPRALDVLGIPPRGDR